MRIVVLGGTGMLGHKLVQAFATQFQTYATIRSASIEDRYQSLYQGVDLIPAVSAENFPAMAKAIGNVAPAVIVNCIGVIKQSDAAKDPLPSIEINSLLPHRLAHLSKQIGCRLIHVSTDCVFSGKKGDYREEDFADAEDLYGRTKFLGEISESENCLTLRTSIIGRELQSSYGLIEWFLTQEKKTVHGFRQAIFSGFTTIALAKILSQIIADHPALHGLWHVSSDPISKLDLLTAVKQAYHHAATIVPNDAFKCDRSLNSERFRKATGLTIPSWPSMIEEMCGDPTPYTALRREIPATRHQAN